MKVDVKISSEILNLIAKIDEFKGRWEALGNISRDHLTQLRRSATIESVGSSTRIEGSRLNDVEVELLLSKIEIQRFDSRDEQEVAGYGKAMNLVYDSWEYLDITENYVQQLHDVLLNFSQKDERHRGSYKTLDNHVAAFDDDGNQVGIVFETSSPFDTPAHMQELLEWYRSSASEHHPLLRIGIFIVWFLAIHPFQDGNGRISRVLTTLQLLREGYEYVPYASIERIVEDNKEHYFRALRQTQSNLRTDEVDWSPWLLFFLRTLWKQCEVLYKKVEVHKVIKTKNLPPLATKVISLIAQHEGLSNRDLVALTGSNSNTMKTILSKLVAEGFITREGSGRATHYKAIR